MQSLHAAEIIDNISYPFIHSLTSLSAATIQPLADPFQSHLIEEARVCSPLEQCLDHLHVPILAGQVEGSETSVIDAIHKAECSKKRFDNVPVSIPCSFVERCVTKL